MSDLCITQLGDNIVDIFYGNDDGIVPDSGCENEGQFPVLVSRRKKQSNEDMGSGTNQLKCNTFINREADMLGRISWPEKNSGGSAVPRDAGSGKDVQDMTLDDTKISDNGFNSNQVDVVENFCTADPMLCDSTAATHDGAYTYSLNNNIPNAGNSLSFLENGEKENNDLLYGWGDIGNFEDMDNMLRSCDSTFGLDGLNNDDTLGWFSSAQPNEDTKATMTDDIKPDIMSENQRTTMLQIEDFLNNNESNDAIEDEYKYTVVGGSEQRKPVENVSDTSLQKKDILMLDEEANLEMKQSKNLHQHDGKNDGYSENSFTLQHSGISREIMDTNQYYPPSAFQQPGVPHSLFNCEQPSDQISPCESKSGIKSENTPNPSCASHESYASNQTQSVESLQGSTVDDRCRKGFEKKVNLQPGEDMHPSFAVSSRKISKKNPMVFPDAAIVQKTGLESDLKKSGVELETSNMQESSCVSSVVDDISLEATSFRQLQHVIEQLDVRTKLCIRNSLYRLAKSAEQRHVNPNDGNSETDKYIGLMDIETDTNPIDRSIAHLLFHRPSDSSRSSDNDVLSYKSHPMIPQPNSSPSLRIEKQEETPEIRTETNDNK